MKEEVDVLGSPSQIVCTVSVDVKQRRRRSVCVQSSGAVWKSRWTSWAPVANSPYGLCGRRAILKKERGRGNHATRTYSRIRRSVLLRGL